jgi:hypothetical protein
MSSGSIAMLYVGAQQVPSLDQPAPAREVLAEAIARIDQLIDWARVADTVATMQSESRHRIATACVVARPSETNDTPGMAPTDCADATGATSGDLLRLTPDRPTDFTLSHFENGRVESYMVGSTTGGSTVTVRYIEIHAGGELRRIHILPEGTFTQVESSGTSAAAFRADRDQQTLMAQYWDRTGNAPLSLSVGEFQSVGATVIADACADLQGHGAVDERLQLWTAWDIKADRPIVGREYGWIDGMLSDEISVENHEVVTGIAHGWVRHRRNKLVPRTAIIESGRVRFTSWAHASRLRWPTMMPCGGPWEEDVTCSMVRPVEVDTEGPHGEPRTGLSDKPTIGSRRLTSGVTPCRFGR